MTDEQVGQKFYNVELGQVANEPLNTSEELSRLTSKINCGRFYRELTSSEKALTLKICTFVTCFFSGIGGMCIYLATLPPPSPPVNGEDMVMFGSGAILVAIGFGGCCAITCLCLKALRQSCQSDSASLV